MAMGPIRRQQRLLEVEDIGSSSKKSGILKASEACDRILTHLEWWRIFTGTPADCNHISSYLLTCAAASAGNGVNTRNRRRLPFAEFFDYCYTVLAYA